MKVLISEDEAVNRRILESLLPMWGYDVVATSCGAEAWKILSEDDGPRFAIVDWMMPGVSGIDLVRRLRSEPAGRYVYVILLTAKDTRADLVEGLEAGADDYLAKPFDPLELRGRMDAARRALGAYDEIESLAHELARKNARLAELTETAHRFVDNVSHEFRTPLTVIKEFSSIIADGLGGPVTEKQCDYLQTITNAVHGLTQMVDDLLDSSKLKSGTLRIHRTCLSLGAIADAVRPLVATPAKTKKIEIDFDVDRDAEVFADRDKVARVLVNLIVNAIKFSPEGSTVRVWSRPTEDGGSELAVTDQGPGLSEEDLEKVFDRFSQVGHGCETSTKGFGLGLNIVRELVWLNLGTVSVATAPGDGSTFMFTLPPDDTTTIIQRYLERIADLPEPRSRLVLLRIDGADPHLRQFVCSSCYATDVVIKTEDPETVLALGLTDSAEGWLGRLHAQRDRLQRDRPDALIGDLSVNVLETWPVAVAAENVLRRIETTLSEFTPCG